MRLTITTRADLYPHVRDMTGSGYWTHDPADHEDASERIADYLWDRAHADPHGPRSGDDWSEWLAEQPIQQIAEEVISTSAD